MRGWRRLFAAGRHAPDRDARDLARRDVPGTVLTHAHSRTKARLRCRIGIRPCQSKFQITKLCLNCNTLEIWESFGWSRACLMAPLPAGSEPARPPPPGPCAIPTSSDPCCHPDSPHPHGRPGLRYDVVRRANRRTDHSVLTPATDCASAGLRLPDG